MLRALARAAVVAFALMTCGAPAQAQYPNRPVTIIVPLAAGSGMDVLVRLYADKLSQSLGKPVVVENRPGASLMLAANAVAQSRARRTHAARLDVVRDGDQSHAVQAGDLRSRSRLHSDLALREVAVHSGGQSGPAGEDGSGADQVHQGEPGQAQLLLARRRRRAASLDGVHEEPVRPGDHACAVSRDAAVDPGHRGRPHRARLGRGRRFAAADQGRQAARARGVVARRGCRCCPTCRRSPKPRPRRASRRCRGTCCSRRRRRRATSSTSCTTR